MDLALNNLQRLICHKTQPSNQKKNKKKNKQKQHIFFKIRIAFFSIETDKKIAFNIFFQSFIKATSAK